jgi:DNA integrity scanning protein DisA with diadenylate cyclase activity
MADKPKKSPPPRRIVALARMTRRVADSVSADAVICGTEAGLLARQVHRSESAWRLVAATPDKGTYDALAKEGLDVVRLPLRVADKYKQVCHLVSVALNAGKVSVGDLVVCVVHRSLCLGATDLLVVTNVDADAVNVALSDLVKLTDGIRLQVLEAALEVACRIGRVSGRGKCVGALMVLGDSTNALKGSKQLILNPLEGHEDKKRFLTDPASWDMLTELAKLDGAFVVRGDGYIRTAGTFLQVSRTDIEIPAGLGARHLAAASVTARTEATAVVVSSTDGQVRVFSGGALVMQLAPDALLGPIMRPA